jgi:hypothetical protein
MADKYRPRLLLIIVCALIIAQIFVITSLKQEVEKQMLVVHTQTLVQNALINLLIEKNVITRDNLAQQAQDIAKHFMEENPAEAPPFDTTGLAPPDAFPAGQ